MWPSNYLRDSCRRLQMTCLSRAAEGPSSACRLSSSPCVAGPASRGCVSLPVLVPQNSIFGKCFLPVTAPSFIPSFSWAPHPPHHRRGPPCAPRERAPGSSGHFKARALTARAGKPAAAPPPANKPTQVPQRTQVESLNLRTGTWVQCA